jgi:hypothetical protein
MSVPDSFPVKGFPPGAEEQFQNLWHQVCRLHADWCLYSGLFGGPNQLEVVKKTVPEAFALIERALRDSMTMTYGRLTDAPGSDPRTNLSLERLLLTLKDHWPDHQEGNWAEKQLRKVRDLGQPLARRRNKQVGHNDLAAALQADAIPLADRTTITKAFEAIADLMNKIEGIFCGQITPYLNPIFEGYGKGLIAWLQVALECNKREKQNRLEASGT